MRLSEIRIPTLSTLRKYGLGPNAWLEILEKQHFVCAICNKVPKSGRWVTDHHHIPKRQWRKLTPEQRRRHVRGIVCPFCNSHVVGRFVTLAKARNVVKYLEAFERRFNHDRAPLPS